MVSGCVTRRTETLGKRSAAWKCVNESILATNAPGLIRRCLADRLLEVVPRLCTTSRRAVLLLSALRGVIAKTWVWSGDLDSRVQYASLREPGGGETHQREGD